MDEYDLIKDALGAVRSIRNHYASTAEGVSRVREVADRLAAAAKNVSSGTTPHALALAIADAIRKTYGGG